MRHDIFQRQVLARFHFQLPPTIAKCVFTAFDANDDRQLSLSEFLCAVAVLLYGTPEQRARFAFNALDINRNGKVTEQTLTSIYIESLGDVRLTQQHADDAVMAVFDAARASNKSTLNWEAFQRWALQGNMLNTHPVLSWMDEIGAALQPQSFASWLHLRFQEGAASQSASARASLARDSIFSEREIEALQHAYARARKLSPAGVVGRVALGALLTRCTPAPVVDALFRVLDADSHGTVGISALASGLGVAVKGDVDQRANFAFRLLRSKRSAGLPQDVMGPSDALLMASLLRVVARAVKGGIVNPTTGQVQEHQLRQLEAEHSTLVSLVDAAGSNIAPLLSESSASAGSSMSKTLGWLTGGRSSLVGGTAGGVGGVQEADDEQSLADLASKMTPQQLLAAACEEMHLQLGAPVSLAAFRSWVSRHPEVLDFLTMLSHVIRVDVGIPPQSVDEERTLILQCHRSFNPQAPGSIGQHWCVVPQGWWNRWTAYVGASLPDAHPPGSGSGCGSAVDAAAASARHLAAPGALPAIPTETLLQDAQLGLMRTALHRGHDYALVPPRVWEALSKWYGAGPCIMRSVVAVPVTATCPTEGGGGLAMPPPPPSLAALRLERAGSTAGTGVELELYPLALVMRRLAGKDAELARMKRPFVFSKYDTVGQVQRAMAKAAGARDAPCRLWYRPEEGMDFVPLPQLSLYLDAADLVSGGEVLIEVQTPDGYWSKEGYAVPQDGANSAVQKGASTRVLHPPGMVGFQNLGNTCYMNAALQALSASRLFREYFTLRAFALDLNEENELGTGGHLAVALFDLLSDVWSSGSSRTVAPRRLKQVIAKARADFEGNDQHDAQEFLDAVLSFLGEDTNRVLGKKPYIALPDSNGRPDAIVAAEWWLAHLHRDRSAVSALFGGQFKSTLQCCNCGFTSCRFELFSLLPLPLPDPALRYITATVFFVWNTRRPLQVSIALPHSATIADVKNALVAMQPGMTVVTREGATPPSNAGVGGVVAAAGATQAAAFAGAAADSGVAVREPKHLGVEASVPRVRLHRAQLYVTHMMGSFLADSQLVDETPLNKLREGLNLEVYQLPSLQQISDAGSLKYHMGHLPLSPATSFLPPHLATCLAHTLPSSDCAKVSQTKSERRWFQRFDPDDVALGTATGSAGAGLVDPSDVSVLRLLAESDNVAVPHSAVLAMATVFRKQQEHEAGQLLLNSSAGAAASGKVAVKKLEPEADQADGTERVKATAAEDDPPAPPSVAVEIPGSPATSPRETDTAAASPAHFNSKPAEHPATPAVSGAAAPASQQGSSPDSLGVAAASSSATAPPQPKLKPRADTELLSPARRIVRPEVGGRVLARFRGGEFFSATITKVHAGDNTFDVEYEGGARAANLPQAHISVVLRRPFEVTLVHRRWEAARYFFLDPMQCTLVGPPSLLRVAPEDTSTMELYALAWLQSKRFIRRRVDPLSNFLLYCADSAKRIAEGNTQPDEEQHGGRPLVWSPDSACGLPDMSQRAIMLTWGFVLKRVTRSGYIAERFTWRSVSDGNIIQPSWERTLGGKTKRFKMAGGTTAHVAAFESAAQGWKTATASVAGAPLGGGSIPALALTLGATGELSPETPPTASGAAVGGGSVHSAVWADGAHAASDGKSGRVHPLGDSFLYRAAGGEDMPTGCTVAVDWEPGLLESALDRQEVAAVDRHPSVAQHAREVDRPLSLAQCLDAFSRPEKLDDTRFCPKCSRSSTGGDVAMRPFTKQLQVWRAPPLLVLQLKRFQHTATVRRKIGNLVQYPLQGLRLGDFMAHEVLQQPPVDTSVWEHLGGKLSTSEGGAVAGAGGGAGGQAAVDEPIPFEVTNAAAREDGFEGVPLSVTRPDGAEYDLYAVVHHLGALGAGHYVASTRGPNGDWRLFNDSNISALPASQVVTSTAYLLFYQRRDMAGKVIGDVFPAEPGAQVADLDKIRKAAAAGSGLRCSIM